jgi:RHS repeat-associated protein
MRFSFTGAPYFSEVGLYQMGARYYNPDIGRFITRDSYRGDIYRPWTRNLYTYCNNNPVNYVDPTGHYVDDSYGYDSDVDDPSLQYKVRFNELEDSCVKILMSTPVRQYGRQLLML